MTQSDLYRFITRHKLAVQGSISANNSPQSALVGIAVTPQLEIIFDTVNTSRKYRNLVARHACSFVIGWTGEQTVQYEGIAREMAGPELIPYQQVYLEAWPECRSHLSWPGLVYFVVQPTWIRYTNFEPTPLILHEFTDFPR